MTHPPAPLRPVSEDHRHADYAPRSAVLSILRDAGVDETIVAQVSDVLLVASIATHPDTKSTGDVREPAGCEHEWRYSGTDYHGSHKGEDFYSCSKCRGWQYRIGDAVTHTVEPKGSTALTQAPRSCCEDERERCAKIAEDYAAEWGKRWQDRNAGKPERERDYQNGRLAGYSDAAACVATAIRSNSHDG